MFIQKQADIFYTCRMHKRICKMVIVLAIILPLIFCLGCVNKTDKLTVVQTKRIEEIVRGLVEADIIFPFSSTQDIPLEFYATYLSMRYDSTELELTNEMQANINYEQMLSIMHPDWGVDDIFFERFIHDKEEFRITLQFGLQGKEYMLNSIIVDNELAVVSVTLTRYVNSIIGEVGDTVPYTWTINYKFNVDNGVVLLSADT